MKIVSRHLERDGSGVVSLIPEEECVHCAASARSHASAQSR
jgi:hypothetical protein